MKTSDLSERIARELQEDIATGTLAPSAHIRAQALAERFGVSRTPVREALELLLQKGLVEQKPNRGFFVDPAAAARTKKIISDTATDVSDYQVLANDWMRGRLPSEVTIQLLQDRYGLTKSRLLDLLARAGREGWAEQKPGYGWRLLPVVSTPEAFEQIYRFRMTIEPAALLEPSFRPDREILRDLRQTQESMLERDIAVASPERLLATGANFHEAIIRMSGNPFFHTALERVNRMRRLMEYRARFDRTRFIRQCTEHLQILDTLETGDILETSFIMRRHLAGALKQKVPVAQDWS
ncbi:MAG: DNA-binding GntR family transcriptional regulator [Limimaricola cinnabarinus]|jgi:DNA-binding GntR family transcriptional regulator|uniref:GntR family transcriptional regulator n=1 Tax=Limimaricola cinnabarinus TaxID=1125964 RepID=UPI0039E61DE9